MGSHLLGGLKLCSAKSLKCRPLWSDPVLIWDLQTHFFETGSTGNIASGLISKIMQALTNCAESTDKDRGLKDELELLH